MATGVKLVTFVAFLRFARGDYLTQDMYGSFATILQWLAVITMFVGNLAAIVQNNLKRMLAYSSIAHSGYILMGLLAAAVGGEVWRGDLAVIYYAVAYAVMTMGAFAVVCLFEKSETDMVMIDDIKGLAKNSPVAAAAFTLFLLSLAGIPPLVGFFGKFFLFSAVIQQGFYWLAAWAAINSVISAYYYLRPIVYMYMRDEDSVEIAPQTKFTQGLIVVMAALVVILGLTTEPFYKEILQAISTLL
jgi:NADH-quinone oxidoreductase subunit N